MLNGKTFLYFRCIRPIILLLCCAMCAATAFAQKEYNVWYFGTRAGITFNTNPVSALTDGNMLAPEGSTSICDNNGILLFYTNGDSVYNRLHQLMDNGVFFPRAQRNSSRQGAMALPYPNQPKAYYIITSSSIEGQINDGYLRYSVVDMQSNGGLGKVTLQNVPLVKGCLEAFGAAGHANGKDYWFASISRDDSCLYTVPTINGNMGIAQKGPKVLQTKRNGNTKNLIKFSPNSSILKLEDSFAVVGTKIIYYYNLYRFDNNTGKISSPVSITAQAFGFGLPVFEFSPDSRFLYAEESDTVAPFRKMVQYDLSVWNSDSISKSRTILVLDSIPISAAYGMQLGPDGKIYVFILGSTKLFAINNPNKKGKACGYNPVQGVDLNGRSCNIGAPYYPTFLFKRNNVTLPPDTVMCQGDTLTIRAIADSGKLVWSTGDTSPSITVTQNGIYWVKYIVKNDTAIDSIKVDFKKPFKVYLGSDTAFCGKFSHILNAGKGAKDYLWNSGDTTITKLVETPGIYSVTIKDTNNCKSGDTINIDQLNAPPVKIGYDSVTCGFVVLTTPLQSGIHYNWRNGDTANSIKVTKKGNYTLTASNLFCSINATVGVTMLAMPEIDLGPDTSLCNVSAILLQAGDSGTYKWNTGAATSTLLATDTGLYTITVTRNNCSATDSIYLSGDCSFWYYIPNAFTPNGDEINNVFSITGEITSAQILVFDRWGEKVFDAEGANPIWDGTYKGVPCPAGIYTYIIRLEGKKGLRTITENARGNVTLIR